MKSEKGTVLKESPLTLQTLYKIILELKIKVGQLESELDIKDVEVNDILSELKTVKAAYVDLKDEILDHVDDNVSDISGEVHSLESTVEQISRDLASLTNEVNDIVITGSH